MKKETEAFPLKADRMILSPFDLAEAKKMQLVFSVKEKIYIQWGVIPSEKEGIAFYSKPGITV